MSKKSETYNSEPFGTIKGRKERSFIGTLFVIVLLALTMSLSIALLIAYLTPYVSPSTFGSLTIVGIFAPILYLCVAVCMLLWIVMRRWKTAIVVALLLLPGAFRYSDFYNIDITRETEQKSDRQSFTLMSYNVRGFYDEEQGRRTLNDFVDYFAESDIADIVCFQEFSNDVSGVERIDSIFNQRYKRCYMRETVENGNVVLRTYSCYPIINSGDISGAGRGTSQWADIVVNNSDTLRIFNNHLYTMNISPDDSEDIAQGKILNDGDRLMSIIDRIANNTSIRADHVDTLRMVIDNTPYQHIVCGDFNDTPMSYVYHKLSRDLVDAFVEQGRGYGYTFRPMHGMLRIDYILHSEGLSSLYYMANENIDISDHLPIVARLKSQQ